MSDLTDHSPPSPLVRYGGSRKLRSCQIAEDVHAAAVAFRDPMVRAARSGPCANEATGSGAAATSRNSDLVWCFRNPYTKWKKEG